MRKFKNKIDKAGYLFGEFCVIMSFVAGMFAFIFLATDYDIAFAVCSLLMVVLFEYGTWRTGGDML